MAKKVTPDSVEMKEMASRICRDYLWGSWKTVTVQDIGFKHISGGLSNLLFHISLPESLAKESEDQTEPKEVLMRIYGQTHGEHALEALITESVVFTLLSERGLGPKLHGIFPGGRIEQYINAKPLKTEELADEVLSVKIAENMATIHNMEVPLHKEPGWLWNTIARWLKTYEVKLQNNELSECVKKVVGNVDMALEVDWLKKRLEAENCPVVFCHNDMQEGNILRRVDDNENNDNETDITIIDFEYCSYNYRSFDIANHFIEWTYDYTNSEHPFFYANPRNYPSKQQKLRFVKTYLSARDSTESPKKVLREVEVFSLASHFFWGLWGIINAGTSQIPFGYWEYSASRLNHYFTLKTKLSDSLPAKRKSCSLE